MNTRFIYITMVISGLVTLAPMTKSSLSTAVAAPGIRFQDEQPSFDDTWNYIKEKCNEAHLDWTWSSVDRCIPLDKFTLGAQSLTVKDKNTVQIRLKSTTSYPPGTLGHKTPTGSVTYTFDLAEMNPKSVNPSTYKEGCIFIKSTDLKNCIKESVEYDYPNEINKDGEYMLHEVCIFVDRKFENKKTNIAKAFARLITLSGGKEDKKDPFDSPE